MMPCLRSWLLLRRANDVSVFDRSALAHHCSKPHFLRLTTHCSDGGWKKMSSRYLCVANISFAYRRHGRYVCPSIRRSERGSLGRFILLPAFELKHRYPSSAHYTHTLAYRVRYMHSHSSCRELRDPRLRKRTKYTAHQHRHGRAIGSAACILLCAGLVTPSVCKCSVKMDAHREDIVMTSLQLEGKPAGGACTCGNGRLRQCKSRW